MLVRFYEHESDPLSIMLGSSVIQLSVLALTVLVTPTSSYDIQIHPEYQQGLAINDVPAERRLHWMRVANEASQSHI